MRLLHIDIDTLRPDHLGCYGYQRNTSPSIDRLAAESVCFDQLYVSDSPCLPSRTALATGRFGIHSGVVNHGGTRAEPFLEGASRGRMTSSAGQSWASTLRAAGLWCATISTFAERHSAFHWYSGFNEVVNLGTAGLELADQVGDEAVSWVRRHAGEGNWYLHVHFWDPHTPYRTPESYGNPFAGEPSPDWIDENVRRRHWELPGPHSAQDVLGYGPDSRFDGYVRQPQRVERHEDVTRMFDGYDTGIRFADDQVGRLLDTLVEQGIDDDTAIMLSSDHGENLGELGIYCDHQTADVYTHRVPAILRWPGVPPAHDAELRYQIDLTATVVDLLGRTPPPEWDGASFADGMRQGRLGAGRDDLVLSCAAWSVQRAVRFDHWLYLRTYHDAYHGFPDALLYDLWADPREQADVADVHPDVCGHAASLLLDWETSAMRRSGSGVDPLWTVMEEGGGYYARGRLSRYRQRLVDTGRGQWAARLAETHPGIGD